MFLPMITSLVIAAFIGCDLQRRLPVNFRRRKPLTAIIDRHARHQRWDLPVA